MTTLVLKQSEVAVQNRAHAVSRTSQVRKSSSTVSHTSAICVLACDAACLRTQTLACQVSARNAPRCHANAARGRRGRCEVRSRRRPEDFAVLYFSETFGGRQSPVDGEPPLRVPEVRQVESPESGQRHPCMADDEVVLRCARPRAVPDTQIERLAPPFREHDDRVVEGPRIDRAEFKQTGELRPKPGPGPSIDLLPHSRRY